MTRPPGQHWREESKVLRAQAMVGAGGWRQGAPLGTDSARFGGGRSRPNQGR